MFQKIVNGAAVLSLVLSGGLAVSAFVGYRYVTGPDFKDKIKEAVMGNVTKSLPSAIGGQLPKSTGPAVPFR